MKKKSIAAARFVWRRSLAPLVYRLPRGWGARIHTLAHYTKMTLLHGHVLHFNEPQPPHLPPAVRPTVHHQDNGAPQVESKPVYLKARARKKKQPSVLPDYAVAELKELADAGLKMAYVGCESGDDEVLARVNKGETYESTLSALDKLGQAGITRSVMILNGLGGQRYSEQHALNSARLMNEAQPEYLSTLVVSFPMGEARFREQFTDYQPLTQLQLFGEVERLLQADQGGQQAAQPDDEHHGVTPLGTGIQLDNRLTHGLAEQYGIKQRKLLATHDYTPQ